MRAGLLLIVALAACKSKERSPSPPPPKPVLASSPGEIGTPTCDALVAYERACMAALLPKYEGQRAEAMKNFEAAVVTLKDLFTNKNVADPIGLAESQCTDMLEKQRQATQLEDVCPTVAVP